MFSSYLIKRNSLGFPKLMLVSLLLIASVAIFAACDGQTGADGPQGATGANGPQGDVGAAGPKGDDGEPGVAGPAGKKGDIGADGATGATGPAGSSAGIEAGDGLDLVNDVISADVAGTGEATTLARSDHDHDTEYYGLSAVDAAIAAAKDWNGLTGVPAGLADGVDADTLASLSCSSGQAATYDAGSWGCSSVAGSSSAGNPITNVITTLTSNTATGQNVVMELGVDGFPIAVYYDRNTRRVNTIHCTASDCSTFDRTIHTSSGTAGEFLDMAIGLEGRPVVSMYDNTTNSDQTVEFNLKVMRCADVACSSSSTITLDESGDVGQHNSIAIRPNGMPVVSYRDATNDDLKFAFCLDAGCGTADITAIDTINDPTHTETIVGFDGLAMVAYRSDVAQSLHVVHCTIEKCTTNTPTTVDVASNTGEYTALEIGSDGLVLIAYFDRTTDSLKITHCSTLDCTGSTTTVADNSGSSGQWPTIMIGSDGLPIVFFEDKFKTALRMLKCLEITCATSVAKLVVSEGVVGRKNVAAMRADGTPIVLYENLDNEELNVLSCANALCIPYGG